MGEFFVYILKSSVCLAVLYLFYRLLLSRETFYNFNRIAILGILVLSLVLPLCEITINKQTEVQQTVLTLEQLLLMGDNFRVENPVSPVNEVSSALWIKYIILIYLAGMVFFLFRNIYSLIRLTKLIRTSVKHKIQKGIWLVYHSDSQYSPFSWMNFIVLSHKDMENNHEIMIHEITHIRKRHSLDLLITDICIIFQWFNPAVWLFRQELQTIHEYQADEAVLDEGVNAKQYQLLLIKKAAGTRLYSMANSFNHSKLKKRITMMLKEKSNPWARLRYLYVFPVAAVAITAFARPEISNELKEISAVKVNDLAGIVETNSTENVLTEIDKLFQENSSIRSDHQSEVTVLVEKGHNEPTIESSTLVADTVITSRSESSGEVSITVNGKQGGPVNLKGRIEKVEPVTAIASGEGTPPIMYIDGLSNDSENFPLIILNGEKISRNVLGVIDPNQFESLSVLKDHSAINSYGTEGKNGVILITTKKISRSDTDAISSEVITVEGLVQDENGKPLAGATVIIQGTPTGTITNVEGNFLLKAPKDAPIEISHIDRKTVVTKAFPKVTVVLVSE